jgi:flagellar motor switch protein FliN
MPHTVAHHDSQAAPAQPSSGCATSRVRVEMGRRTQTTGRLSALTPGSVIDLDRECDSPVDVYADGKLIALGEPVVVGGRLAVRVTEIIDTCASERVAPR